MYTVANVSSLTIDRSIDPRDISGWRFGSRWGTYTRTYYIDYHRYSLAGIIPRIIVPNAGQSQSIYLNGEREAEGPWQKSEKTLAKMLAKERETKLKVRGKGRWWWRGQEKRKRMIDRTIEGSGANICLPPVKLKAYREKVREWE